MEINQEERDLIASDINAYLQQHQDKDLLRLLTCGSVDDGKSTLIGRLLYDSKLIYEDQLAAVVKHGWGMGWSFVSSCQIDPSERPCLTAAVKQTFLGRSN